MRFSSLLLLAAAGLAAAEDGLNAWLRYARIQGAKGFHNKLPSAIVTLNATEGSPVYTAGKELVQGLDGIFGKQVKHLDGSSRQKQPATVAIVATVNAYVDANPAAAKRIPQLADDGFYLDVSNGNVLILGQNERGALYGAFHYLNLLAQGKVSNYKITSNPDAPIRWVNQWDNMQDGGTHGSVERGYGGKSIFFWDGKVRDDLTRVRLYARLLASIGINAVVVNNVNADPNLLKPENMDGLARIANEMRPYGVQLGLALNFASPQTLGGLDTFDPFEQKVVDWWQNIADELYKRIPDMAGYLVKANSEGQPGPMTYNRTLADGANMFARTVKKYGGVVLFRAFVYNHQTLNQDKDWKADRANAAVQYFDGLDEKFEDNVVIQIKYGPIDFQVREPVSPLFSHLRKTATAIELQITQEYLGQQAHLVYLAPMWKEILDFDFRVDGKRSVVTDILNGKRFNRKLGGYAGVANVGTNTTWLGSHLAMSNLYAFGKLAWNPSQTPVSILQEWIKLTFSDDPKVLDVITKMSMASWPAYENYSGNLGIQTLTDILNGHYGPNPASQDGNPWGQWTRADADSIGMDRTVWNGTGFAGQYPPEVAAKYEKPETTPDNLLLWFHHVPYTYRLKSGKTVIQHFYDAHYEGSATAQTFPKLWESLKGRRGIDQERYEHVLFRLVYQAGHSLVWRDSINNFYFNKSGIPDAKGRVGNYRYRIEAEKMDLKGYRPYDVHPFESASGTKCIVTETNSTVGVASTVLSNIKTGRYDVAVNYYDLAIGNSTWELFIDNQRVGKWKGDLEYTLGKAPTLYIDGQTATRITFKGVKVKKGSVLKIVGTPDGQEPAPVDYVSILPEGIVD
ncbi:alpha-glucuronidase-like protein [Thermochaetoides thermophila DSM 1495]|uniref:Alpha-glucuronidase n=1 Tax=Chaetomium thermophilum (strain DSM 1495 / CBS 144.50 / IMI 039719) TaxID=759272 RepID=G0S1X2_CHATD|nr:alpha-glucuronidase-like protein [Thermochaetoides thermophila DSM 1495]EGS23032.1 alpha-glucuronidase-like protein [Thermochaetoides thermophila DSM 1495]